MQTHGRLRELGGWDVVRAARARATLWLQAHRVSVRLRSALPLLLLGVGAALFARACRGLDWPLALGAIRRAGPRVGLLLLAPLVGNFLHMLGWRALLPREARPELWRAFRIFVSAQAGNELGCGVLGESLKVTALPPAQRRAATAAVLLDNSSSLLALVAVLATLALLACSRGALLASRSTLAGVMLAAALSACVALAGLRRKLRGSARAFAIAFGLHYLGKLWIVAELALALALLGSASLHSSALLGLSSLLASSIGALVPAQLGVVEAALLGSASAAQLSVSCVLGVALLRRIRGLAWLALGGLFVAGLSSPSKTGGIHASTAIGQ